jgi:DHA2 family multidrug resistance protein-like MFS transporter
MLLALPHLSEALKANSTQQLWVIDIYGFMLAGFLITMGTLGDRIGRRKLLLIGAAAFGVASVLSAFSTSAAMLIAARALLGIAGATLTPSTLSLISAMFRDPKQRAFAIGVWGGCFSVGAIIGPVIGGVMLEHFWWGSVFLLGLPAMLLLLVLGPMLLPEHRDPGAGRLDLISVALSLAAILPIIYGFKELARNGWQPLPIMAIVAGAAVGWVFMRRQRRLSDPLLDLRLFASRAFSIALLSLLFNSMLSGTTMAFIMQHLQLVEGLSPLWASLGMIPGMVASIVSFQLTPLLMHRIRPAYLIGTGLAIAVVGFLVITQASATSGPVVMAVGFAISALGSGPIVTTGTNLVIGSAPPEKAGSAAALTQTSNEFGIALGIGMLGSIGTAVYRSQIAGALPFGIPATAAQAARDTLAGATVAAQHLPNQLATALLTPAREAFTSELHVIATISAILLMGMALLVVIMLRHVRPSSEGQPEQPDGADAAQVTVQESRQS